MASNLLGLARQLSSATFDICEALLRQADSLTTPPPPGSTPVPPFQPPKSEQPVPQQPAAFATGADSDLELTVRIEGSAAAAAHSRKLARPDTPTAAEQLACDGLLRNGSAAPPITAVSFARNENGRGLIVTIKIPEGQPAGVYVGSVYCATQPLPLGQLVIEIKG